MDKKPGIVYVITNKGLKGLVKIGMVESTDPKRIKTRISHFQAGSPYPYVAEYAATSEDVKASEDDLHEIQKSSQVKDDGGGDEWFAMSVDSAKKMLDLIQGLKPIPVDVLKAALTSPSEPQPKAQVVNEEIPIRMTHKKQEYRGTLLPDGSVRSENGQIFRSPTRASEELAGAVANGWDKWKYHADGEWRIINKLPQAQAMKENNRHKKRS